MEYPVPSSGHMLVLYNFCAHYFPINFIDFEKVVNIRHYLNYVLSTHWPHIYSLPHIGCLFIVFCMQNMYVQVTNENGSTRDHPVTVQVSVMSDLGSILPQRLKQLAQTITGSPAKNLGLDNSVFGRVKQISLSSYLNSTLQASSPTPSPAPSPVQNDYAEPSYSPSPAISPYFSPAPLPHFRHLPPCFACDASSPSDGSYPTSPSPVNGPRHSLPPKSNAPAHSIRHTRSPHPSPHCGSDISPSPLAPSQSNPLSPNVSPHSSTPTPPTMAPASQMSPGLSPLPVVSYGSNPGQDKENGHLSVSPLTSSCKLLLTTTDF